MRQFQNKNENLGQMPWEVRLSSRKGRKRGIFLPQNESSLVFPLSPSLLFVSGDLGREGKGVEKRVKFLDEPSRPRASTFGHSGAKSWPETSIFQLFIPRSDRGLGTIEMENGSGEEAKLEFDSKGSIQGEKRCNVFSASNWKTDARSEFRVSYFSFLRFLSNLVFLLLFRGVLNRRRPR